MAAGFARFDRNRNGKLNMGEYQALEAQRERGAVTVDDAQLIATIRTALHAVPGFPEKGVKIEALSGNVVLGGVVPGAADVRNAWLATRRIAGIKMLDNRLVSGALLAGD